MVQHVKQAVAPADLEPHGVLHLLLEHIPGGEWIIVGGFLIGMGTVGWWKFGRYVEGWIIAIVKRRMDQRKP